MRLYWLLAALIGLIAGEAQAAWNQARTRHFIIYADSSANELRDYATRLELFDQAVRTARSMDDPVLSDANRLTIYMLKDVPALAEITQAGQGVYGVYVNRAAGSFAFVAKRKAEYKADISSDIIFFHEYAHHLMLQNAAASYPPWLVEGFAEFFSTAKVGDDGSVTLGAAANHRSIGVFSIDHDYTLSAMVGNLPRQMTAWQEELMYSRGWLLTHYLTFEPSRRGQLDRYLAGIRSGQTPLASAKAVFGDLKQLDRELDRYASAKTMSAIVVKPDRDKLGTIEIRALGAAESAMMPVRIRSDYGVWKSTAPRVAGQARKVAAQFPNDPFVLATLAEAEHDAENYTAAIAAADRALTVQPSNSNALIYKGRALMQLAEKDPAKADWPAIRSWFAKANRLDPEDPEPLMLFYYTFEVAKLRPTENAVKGLLYALALAPQDKELRLIAVKQLLRDNKLADAKRDFAPLAFNPHAGSFRAVAERVNSAIDTGDAAKALGIIEAWQKD